MSDVTVTTSGNVSERAPRVLMLPGGREYRYVNGRVELRTDTICEWQASVVKTEPTTIVLTMSVATARAVRAALATARAPLVRPRCMML